MIERGHWILCLVCVIRGEKIHRSDCTSFVGYEGTSWQWRNPAAVAVPSRESFWIKT